MPTDASAPAQSPGADFDLLAIGELLVDLISTEPADSLSTARAFERHQGGSPANIAVNTARLGGRAAMMADVGDDAFGAFLVEALARAGVATDYITTDPDAHTSLVFVARTTTTPDFLPLRDADWRLTADGDALARAIARTRAVHTSTWPLSREPARSLVQAALQMAQAQGKLTSLDPNYSPRVWPDRQEALAVLEATLPHVAIVKPSRDDAARLFGEPLSNEDILRRFHAMGPEIVILTMGAEGTLLFESGETTHIPARPIEVVDATGAGDAFWSGFLLAKLEGLSTLHAGYVAREIVERKLQTVGPLPSSLDREAIYEQTAPP
ncbi:MAG: carbohydrate kinase family protein [Anaerolineae bacterium]